MLIKWLGLNIDIKKVIRWVFEKYIVCEVLLVGLNEGFGFWVKRRYFMMSFNVKEKEEEEENACWVLVFVMNALIVYVEC